MPTESRNAGSWKSRLPEPRKDPMPAFLVPRSSARRSRLRSLSLLMVAALAVLGLGRIQDLLPQLSNPFASSTVDRSAPTVLAALEDVSQFKAATANYSVIIDLEEDTRFVPSFVKGERTVFMATGAVDAAVSFAELDSQAVRVTGDSVTLHLPAAELGSARINPRASRVVSRDRGVLDRVGSVFSDSPTSERSLYLAAEQKLDRAASADPEIRKRAEQNTTRMLQRLLEPLGFAEVSVIFD